jgi:hypothetical protein
MELFDIIKKVFDPSEKSWREVSKYDKTRNFFMINRMMAIKFPVQSNLFNNTKVSPNTVVDWWWDNLSKKMNKPPYWIFTKTKKSEKKEEKTKNKIDYSETEDFICQKFEISKRELSDLKNFYPDKYQEWVSEIHKQINLILKR